MKIVLDPGHYEGYNRGYDKHYAEGTAMFNYAYMLSEQLVKKGFEVIVTRKKLVDNPGLMERGQMAKNADIFVSLHSNGVDSPNAYGVSTFYSVKRTGDKDAAQNWCDRLAKLINGGTRSRGASARKGSGSSDYYGVIRGAISVNCPHAFIIEHGFHSNPDECAWLMKEENLLKMAELESEIICDVMNFHVEEKNPEELHKNFYKVNTPGDTLNVRISPDYRSEKIAELNDGEIVYAIDTANNYSSNGWFFVHAENCSGWVNSVYLIDYALKENTPIYTRLMKVTTPYIRGDDVKWVQNRLIEFGYNPGKADGIYGNKTKSAVMYFQTEFNLAVDGMVGEKTWNALVKGER